MEPDIRSYEFGTGSTPNTSDPHPYNPRLQDLVEFEAERARQAESLLVIGFGGLWFSNTRPVSGKCSSPPSAKVADPSGLLSQFGL